MKVLLNRPAAVSDSVPDLLSVNLLAGPHRMSSTSSDDILLPRSHSSSVRHLSRRGRGTVENIVLCRVAGVAAVNPFGQVVVKPAVWLRWKVIRFESIVNNDCTKLKTISKQNIWELFTHFYKSSTNRTWRPPVHVRIMYDDDDDDRTCLDRPLSRVV